MGFAGFCKKEGAVFKQPLHDLQVFYYSDRISTIRVRFSFTLSICLIALLNGVNWTFPQIKPAISALRPSISPSTAATPKRLANTRSIQVGEPPRWIWPKIERR